MFYKKIEPKIFNKIINKLLELEKCNYDIKINTECIYYYIKEESYYIFLKINNQDYYYYDKYTFIKNKIKNNHDNYVPNKYSSFLFSKTYNLDELIVLQPFNAKHYYFITYFNSKNSNWIICKSPIINYDINYIKVYYPLVLKF